VTPAAAQRDARNRGEAAAATSAVEIGECRGGSRRDGENSDAVGLFNGVVVTSAARMDIKRGGVLSSRAEDVEKEAREERW
jgi:hypothetical protein